MTAPVPLEVEEDNEELTQRDAMLKNRRGRELALLLAVERIAQAQERNAGLMSLILGELETQRKMESIRGRPRKPTRHIPPEQTPEESETPNDLPEMPS